MVNPADLFFLVLLIPCIAVLISAARTQPQPTGTKTTPASRPRPSGLPTLRLHVGAGGEKRVTGEPLHVLRRPRVSECKTHEIYKTPYGTFCRFCDRRIEKK